MRIAFVDVIPWNYRVDTVYRFPLGGSQSAVCYLAEALVALGHEVYLLNHTREPARCRGVQCLSLGNAPGSMAAMFDTVIVLNNPDSGPKLRPMLRRGARLVLWTQHATDQPSMRPLADPTVLDTFDAVAFVSSWQQEQYQHSFAVPRHRSRIMRNAIAPAFAALFRERPILAAKRHSPLLAYTSTPFRGLDVLLQLFPAIRADWPDVTLRVYSSMRVYQMNQAEDEGHYGHLYRRCRAMPGIEYVGSLPQPELAEQLAEALLLAYPNHFPETSCISVMEAMACGCQVITSDLGALRETTSGFARLVPVDSDWKRYATAFVGQVSEALHTANLQRTSLEKQLARQVAYINAECTWQCRATEWSQWLAELA